ncbi:MAG: hypothetical protein JW774_01850 [Candidatus Aureabacteria bacterium]|nr:hypothetical protein [Candidatus Auribacterota bacterium]
MNIFWNYYITRNPSDERLEPALHECGITLKKLDDFLDQTTTSIVQRDLENHEFEKYDAGAAMQAFYSPSFPGIILKTPNPNFRNLREQYNLAKKHLRGIFAPLLLTNVYLMIDGEKKYFPELIVQTKIDKTYYDMYFDKDTGELLPSIEQKTQEEIEADVERIVESYITVTHHYWELGIGDKDFLNFMRNYGFLEQEDDSVETLGIDLDGLTTDRQTLEDQLADPEDPDKRPENSPALTELLGYCREEFQQEMTARLRVGISIQSLSEHFPDEPESDYVPNPHFPGLDQVLRLKLAEFVEDPERYDVKKSSTSPQIQQELTLIQKKILLILSKPIYNLDPRRLVQIADAEDIQLNEEMLEKIKKNISKRRFADLHRRVIEQIASVAISKSKRDFNIFSHPGISELVEPKAWSSLDTIIYGVYRGDFKSLAMMQNSA